jgi:hypothetical protein
VLTPENIPAEAELEEQTSKLNQALKSCRALVSSYRTLLTSDLASDDMLEKQRRGLDRAEVSDAE